MFSDSLFLFLIFNQKYNFLGGGNISLDSITRSDVNDPTKYLYGQFYIKIGNFLQRIDKYYSLYSLFLF